MQKSETHRYAIRLAFHGASFSGWQIQLEQKTVQGELTVSLNSLLKEDVKIIGAGRTDTGVHALNYVAHFDTQKVIEPEEIVSRLNRFLPERISIFEIKKVNTDFHARFSATSRSYSYTIRREKYAFQNDMVWNYNRDIDYKILDECALSLKSTKNFSAFERSGSDNTNSICEILHASWVKENGSVIFQIKANRFLRNMVRSIVGTMVETANGKRSVHDWNALLLGGNRSDSGNSAPSQGLIFMGVTYPKTPFYEREVSNY
jgi:tRNA pseudouridine38-40 synthase|tara:strand:- start:14703 stop:15485 length:783 start_codon:yes stop_codon:yes gene_type:complete